MIRDRFATLHSLILLNQDLAANRSCEDVDLRVSLTTHPRRGRSIVRTLQSIRRQSLAPRSVTVYLSEEEYPNRRIPSILQSMTQDWEQLVFTFVPGNERSYKKLLPEIRAGWHEPIVTADDDVLYPRNWLRTLWAAHRRFPKSVIGTRGVRMRFGDDGRLTPYVTWTQASLDVPSPDVFLTGRGGILYPPRCLHSDVTSYSAAHRLAPTADDVWFKAMALRAGADAVVTGGGEEYPAAQFSDPSGLFRQNVDGGLNDFALKDCFDVYSLYG